MPKLTDMANVEWAMLLTAPDEGAPAPGPAKIPGDTPLRDVLNPLTAKVMADAGLTTVGQVRVHWEQHRTLTDIPRVKAGRESAILTAIGHTGPVDGAPSKQDKDAGVPVAVLLAAGKAVMAFHAAVHRRGKRTHPAVLTDAGADGPLAVVELPEGRFLRLRWHVPDPAHVRIHAIQALRDGKHGPATTRFCEIPAGRVPEGLVRVPPEDAGTEAQR